MVAMATYSFHSLIMRNVEIGNFYCLIGDNRIIFLQKCLLNIYLTTLLTSPIKFSLYFQNYVRYLYENFREVRKIYETGVRSKLMRVNLFIKGPRYLNTATLVFESRKNR